jgi:hypothetical protein
MSGCRRRNNISLITVDGVGVEGVQNIRSAVFNHFSSYFKSRGAVRPSVSGLPFRKLSFTEGGSLTKPFSMDEVKQAVWECDSFKSPSPDGINFGFLKEFWDLIKVDFMRFISQWKTDERYQLDFYSYDSKGK